MCIPWGGTRILPQGCTIVPWLLLLCLHIPSLPWLATVPTCPLELREGHEGWMKPISYKQEMGGLPWWRSGWESACQCRGHGFEPWSGKIPHTAEQLGLWATITEPACLEPVLRNKRGRDTERPAHRDEEWPPLAATGESPHTETKTQHSQK